jgi:peroxiredoxin
MKSLNAQLLAFKASVFDRADRETARNLKDAEANYRRDTVQATHLTIGDRAPDFVLGGVDGKRHQLHNYVIHGPVFVLFFRGGWCPYSALTLRAWEVIADDVRRAGASILAISPQKISRAALLRDCHGVSFPILADCGNKVAQSFGVLAQVSALSRELLIKIGCNLCEENTDGSWALPRASEFLIDQDGIIQFAQVWPVHFERTEPSEALATLRALQAKALTPV